MKKHLLSAIALSLSLVLTGLLPIAINSVSKEAVEANATQHISNYDEYSYDGSYYDSITDDGEGLNGSLRTALSEYILPKEWPTYSGTSSSKCLAYVLQDADEDQDNKSNMVYLYTRDSVAKNPASSWNREHTWPKSLSGGNWGEGKGGSDLLHLRPTYNTVNSTRSSIPFGNVGSGGTTLTYNGMTYGKKLNSSKFEPLDTAKGDIARIIMYVWVAYKNYYSSMPDITKVFESYDTLLEWHTLDRPDIMEGHRNDYAESSFQKNRNPFVDHPEYAWKIFGDSASSSVKEACKEAYPESGTKTLTSLTVTTKPAKLTYYIDQTLDTTGAVITANYDDGSSANVTSKCTFSPTTFDSLGTKTITVSYNGKSTSFTVTVKDYEPVTLTGITATISATSIEQTRSAQIVTSFTPSDAYPYPSVTYGSANTSIATVSSSGEVTGINVGSTTITLTVTQNSIVFNREFVVNVTEKEMERIEDVYSKSKGDTAEFYCLYLGAYNTKSQGIFVGDGDYGMLIYGYSKSLSATPYETYLKVSGTVDIFNNLYEIKSATIEVVDSTKGKALVNPVTTYKVTGEEVVDGEVEDLTIMSRPSIISGTVSNVSGTFASNDDTTVTFTLTNSKTFTVFVKKNAGLDYSTLKSKIGTVGLTAKVKGFMSVYSTSPQLILPTIVDESSSYLATNFANDFLSATTPICSNGGSENNRNALIAIWSSLELDKFAILSTSEANKLKNASASESGTNIEQAMARYDYVTVKYQLNNFIERATANAIYHPTNIINIEPSAYLIVIVTGVSLTLCLSIYIFKRKRH